MKRVGFASLLALLFVSSNALVAQAQDDVPTITPVPLTTPVEEKAEVETVPEPPKTNWADAFKDVDFNAEVASQLKPLRDDIDAVKQEVTQLKKDLPELVATEIGKHKTDIGNYAAKQSVAALVTKMKSEGLLPNDSGTNTKAPPASKTAPPAPAAVVKSTPKKAPAVVQYENTNTTYQRHGANGQLTQLPRPVGGFPKCSCGAGPYDMCSHNGPCASSRVTVTHTAQNNSNDSHNSSCSANGGSCQQPRFFKKNGRWFRVN